MKGKFLALKKETLIFIFIWVGVLHNIDQVKYWGLGYNIPSTQGVYAYSCLHNVII